MSLLQDFLPGPLDLYRKKASFDWKKLKIFLDTEEVVEFQNEVYEILRTHPEFQNDIHSKTFDEERRIATRRVLAADDIEQLSAKSIAQNVKRAPAIRRITTQLSPASFVKFGVSRGMFTGMLRSQGTERHKNFLQQAENKEICGCFCLTEIGHGSNTKGMRTTATFDQETQQFVLNTPDFQVAKCWAGGLGQMASHAAVYAQLYVNGKHYGLHTFIVPIRDPKTWLSYPGAIVGDMGEKIGLNGVDNGFLIFDKYRIPRENLLNKHADVTSDGKYITSFKTQKDRHGNALGTLSLGRVTITAGCECYGTKAITIAIRYAAVRKQFGPDGENEVSILEYQSHQHRLFPYLAAAYVVKVFGSFLIEVIYKMNEIAKDSKTLAQLGMEIHVVSSASKPVAGWLFRDAIQECREACGGHGYLKASGIGELRNDQDASNTYEGENHVLIQQTSNWLIKLWSKTEKSGKISTPLGSANFLSDGLQILETKFKAKNFEEVCCSKNILDAYQWLVCYLLRETVKKLEILTPKDGPFWAKNNTQVFYAKSAAIAFIQHFFLQRMLTTLNESSDPAIKKVLMNLFSLYGLWSLEKFLSTFYEGGYVEGSQPSQLIHAAILKLCSDIKDDAVSLVDAIAPPDFMLNSVLGASDGQVYHRLQSAFFQSPHCMSRPSWWQEIVNWQDTTKNKL